MKRFTIYLILGMVLAVSAFAQIDLQPAAIVSLTRSEPITVRQYRNEIDTMERQAGRPLTSAERRQILDVMINNVLVLQAAERDRITISEGEVNQEIQQLRTNMAQSLGRQPTDAEFAQAVRNETGLELPAFREQLRRQLLIQRYILARRENDFRNIRIPTEADIANTYNLTRTQFIRPDTVRVTMIQIPFTDAATRARARETADRLVREIGTDTSRFDAAVLRGRPFNANADYEAGDAGYLPRNMEAMQMVGQDFMHVAFRLRQGEVSRLLETPRSFQIIKVTESHAQRILELDDIFQLGTTITVRDYIGNVLLQQNQQEVLTRVTQELIIELRTGNPFRIYENNLNW